jgi:hypothetical protein
MDKDYISFLLRLSRRNTRPRWRVTLIDPQNGERHTFETLAACFKFLGNLTGEPDDQGELASDSDD